MIPIILDKLKSNIKSHVQIHGEKNETPTLIMHNHYMYFEIFRVIYFNSRFPVGEYIQVLINICNLFPSCHWEKATAF